MSYDAVRIPLYMAMAGAVPARFLEPYDLAWNRKGGGAPVAYDLSRGRVLHVMGDPGYRAIAALVACAVRGERLPEVLLDFRPTTYFASSLHLLALATARRHYPQCLPAPRPAVLASSAAGETVLRR